MKLCAPKFMEFMAGCVHIASQNIRQIQANQLGLPQKNVLRFHYTKMLLFTAKNHFCHTKLQTRVIKVVLSKFFSKCPSLIANWSSDPKPIILAILKSALKLIIISFQYGQQMTFLKN